MAGEVRIVDLDAYEPTNEEIVSWYDMMTSPDQLLWEFDESWAREPTTPQQTIESFRKRRAEQRGTNHPFWAITAGRVVGMIGINCPQDGHRRHCGEIGFGVAEAFTRRGIGSRLLDVAIQKARRLNLKRLEADCFDDNAASIALLRKCGFEEEGVRLGAICKHGKLRNQKLFGLLL